MRPLIHERKLAETLGVKPNTLAKYRVRGFGPKFLKIGNRVAYDPADVEAWIECQKVNSTSEGA